MHNNCEAEGSNNDLRSRETWKEVVDKDMLDQELKLGFSMDRSRWKAKSIDATVFSG